MKPCSVNNLNGFIGFFIILVFQSQPFYFVKVHIKYEKRKNEAIKLSIKDLKGLWKAA